MGFNVQTYIRGTAPVRENRKEVEKGREDGLSTVLVKESGRRVGDRLLDCQAV